MNNIRGKKIVLTKHGSCIYCGADSSNAIPAGGFIVGAEGIATILLSLVTISAFGRRMASAVDGARNAALRLGEGSFVPRRTGEPEIDEIIGQDVQPGNMRLMTRSR